MWNTCSHAAAHIKSHVKHILAQYYTCSCYYRTWWLHGKELEKCFTCGKFSEFFYIKINNYFLMWIMLVNITHLLFILILNITFWKWKSCSIFMLQDNIFSTCETLEGKRSEYKKYFTCASDISKQSNLHMWNTWENILGYKKVFNVFPILLHNEICTCETYRNALMLQRYYLHMWYTIVFLIYKKYFTCASDISTLWKFHMWTHIAIVTKRHMWNTPGETFNILKVFHMFFNINKQKTWSFQL